MVLWFLFQTDKKVPVLVKSETDVRHDTNWPNGWVRLGSYLIYLYLQPLKFAVVVGNPAAKAIVKQSWGGRGACVSILHKSDYKCDIHS